MAWDGEPSDHFHPILNTATELAHFHQDCATPASQPAVPSLSFPTLAKDAAWLLGQLHPDPSIPANSDRCLALQEVGDSVAARQAGMLGQGQCQCQEGL